ncbi:uncharacterized protein LOC126371427 [Pectinophora gossypiella]|uniref:uncharacterized protein LOC126371427 n=1 Tax=Pectinophora gossypiella TaxID=13191 RepID=UPI00214E8AC2|nr:uncharacterized protein LOC126371427 [Pectinophora gossypiella]
MPGNTPPPPPPPPVEPLAVISISNRIANFWTDQPRAWFVHAESTLLPQNTSDEVKYNVILSKLDKETITQITDLISSPPATGKYTALKNRLLQIYEESESRQLQKLIGEMELGDQKPSHLLRRMRQLAKDKVPDTTLMILWQNLLPSWVRGVLTVVEEKDLSKLAELADKMLETSRAAQVESVGASTSTAPPLSSDAAMIVAEIAKLNIRMTDLERSRPRFRHQGGRGRRDFRGRSGSRRSNSRRRNENNPNWLCHFHFRYRERATRCEEPCAWKKQGN